jgi:hypothetical protein
MIDLQKGQYHLWIFPFDTVKPEINSGIFFILDTGEIITPILLILLRKPYRSN